MHARLSALEARLDAVLPNLATKADVVEVEGKVVRWVAGIGIATVTVLVSVMGFLFSRIDFKPAAAGSNQPPIIINVPAITPPGAATPPKREE